jgi:hypothetical protein
MDDITRWKALAAAALSRQHSIDPTKVPERLWNELYVSGCTPREAAERARAHFNNARPMSAVEQRARRQLGDRAGRA